MNIWELPKEHYNWESPITKIYGDMHNEIVRQDEENCTFAIEQAIGYKVDKEELIKALQYDRNQYDKGYSDGRASIIEELENIKKEINLVKGSVAETQEDLIRMETRNDDIKIIDQRIAELKGENKDCIDCNNNCDNGCCKKGCIGYCEGKYWTPKAELKGENNA